MSDTKPPERLASKVIFLTGTCSGMGQAIALDGKADGIRSACASPVAVRPPELERNILKKVLYAEEMMKNMLPAGRAGEVEDIANLAAYLASDEAIFLTGTEILVDGGMTAI